MWRMWHKLCPLDIRMFNLVLRIMKERKKFHCVGTSAAVYIKLIMLLAHCNTLRLWLQTIKKYRWFRVSWYIYGKTLYRIAIYRRYTVLGHTCNFIINHHNKDTSCTSNKINTNERHYYHVLCNAITIKFRHSNLALISYWLYKCYCSYCWNKVIQVADYQIFKETLCIRNGLNLEFWSFLYLNWLK